MVFIFYLFVFSAYECNFRKNVNKQNKAQEIKKKKTAVLKCVFYIPELLATYSHTQSKKFATLRKLRKHLPLHMVVKLCMHCLM